MAHTIWKLIGIAAVIGLIGWIWFTRPEAPSDPARPDTASTMGRTPVEHPAVPPSPFLASHESRSVSRPDAEDVAPEFHIELERLKRQVAEHPDDASSRLKLAQMLQDGHQEAAAIVEYRTYLAQVPHSREAWLDLAKAQASVGDWSTALETCDSLLVRFPDDPSGLYNKGAVLANLNRPADARAFWIRAQSQDEDVQIKKMAELAISRLEN